MTARRTARLLALVLAGVLPAPARATGRDFIDETMISQEFESRELGLEFGAESRLDRDYRVQGWYRWEAETAVTGRWFLESAVQAVSRGQGIELGGWVFGTRVRLASQTRWPVDVSAAVEYEVQTAAAKHTNYERELVPRLLVTRTWPFGLLLTANLGTATRLSPSPVTRFAWGAGARFPEGGPLMAGAEIAHEPLEKATRITPQLWIALPREMRLRLGGVFGTSARPYWFVARLILETEF